MERRASLRPALLVAAIGVAAALVISAPFIGFIRSWIRSTFPGEYVRIIGGTIAILSAMAIALAISRIRENRIWRYAALAVGLGGAVWFSLVEATGNPDVDVVQRFHFVEYGIITFLFYRAWRPLEDGAIFILPVFAGLLVGTADEWLQWFIPNRVGEIADVLLNGMAIGCGLVFSVGADPPERFHGALQPGSILRIGRLGALTILALALFVHVVHLGYAISDDRGTVFKSRYSLSALQTLAVAKRTEWQLHPLPLVLQRVSREDQYMTEGVTHVQRRNELLAANDLTGAWKENLILEKYYGPVLDTPSYVSRTGHRWSAEQRTSVESRAAGRESPYASTANPYPIYTWSKPLFWLLAVTAASLVWLASVLLEKSGRARRASPAAV